MLLQPGAEGRLSVIRSAPQSPLSSTASAWLGTSPLNRRCELRPRARTWSRRLNSCPVDAACSSTCAALET